MDIKDLNKTQLILLAVLLSFIVSIVTGIVTVTLMQQAPSSVTVPINRVVRQTIEKIVPSPGVAKTILIKEEDLVVDALAKNKSAIFSIFKETKKEELSESKEVVENLVGIGFIINAEGVIVTDNLLNKDEIYYVQSKDQKTKTKADFVRATENGFSFLKIIKPASKRGGNSFAVPVFTDLSKMRVGQRVLVSGESVSSFIFNGIKDLESNLIKEKNSGLVLNLDGEILGLALLDNKKISFNLITSINKILNQKDLKVSEEKSKIQEVEPMKPVQVDKPVE
jgi:hypothetical protein